MVGKTAVTRFVRPIVSRYLGKQKTTDQHHVTGGSYFEEIKSHKCVHLWPEDSVNEKRFFYRLSGVLT